MNDDIQAQIDLYELTKAMFCGPGELTELTAIDPAELEANPGASIPPEISFQLNIPLEMNPSLLFELIVCLPLNGCPDPQLSLRNPSWLNRKLHEELEQELPTGPDCIMEAADFLRDPGSKYGPQAKTAPDVETRETEDLVRSWMKLVSLSTRSKRDDMVNWAPDFELTGFVMAGKPAVLCLEGTPSNIDTYMSKIKAVSWADIPSFQKKISLVLQESISTRVFGDMIEITDLFTMGGFRGNRPEMTEVKAWFESKSVGHAFSPVFGIAE